MSDLSLSRPVDRRTLPFQPLGPGGELPPAVAAELLDKQMARLAVPEALPPSVRSQFEKVKDLYRDGLFHYDNFQTAEREAYRVLEAALKVCFLNHYESRLPVVVATKTVLEPISQWRDVERLLQRRANMHPRLAGHRDFNGSLMSLLRWARKEHYLYGQRNRRHEWLAVQIRNDLTHTEHDLVEMPPEAFRSIRSVWEVICRLSAVDPVGGGRDYPAPVERVPMLYGKGPGEYQATVFGLDALRAGDDPQDGDRTWYVVLGNLDEGRRLFDWQDGYELTRTPFVTLWGPGNWANVRAAVEEQGSSWTADTATLLDRIFYSRILPDRTEWPRTAAQVKELNHHNPDERWIVVQADDPRDALVHARNVADGMCSAHCGCAVTVLRDGVRRHRVDEFIRSGVRAIPGSRGSSDA